MSSEILKTIRRKIQDRVKCKELYSVFTNSEEIKSITNCINTIKSNETNQEKLNLLKDIYTGLDSMFIDISTDWDSNRGSLSSEKIDIHYQNLGSILEVVTRIQELKTGFVQAFLIPGLDESALIRDIESLQKNMKEALEKMQQQDEARQKELEEKAKEEFNKNKYIENGTVDAVSIANHTDRDFLYATIKLKDDNKNTDIKVSEFLNSDFCKKTVLLVFLFQVAIQKNLSVVTYMRGLDIMI